MTRIIQGFMQFRKDVLPEKETLIRSLANGQSPQALFITCSDSRLNPNLLTQTEPGDLFIIRNAGNIVPPHTCGATGETATIEYAVQHLKVRDIFVCGHTHCGAMGGLLKPEALSGLPLVRGWLSHAESLRDWINGEGSRMSASQRLARLVELNTLLQTEHVRAQPTVKNALEKGTLRLHSWVYRLEDGMVQAFDQTKNSFVALEDAVRQKMGSEVHKAASVAPLSSQVGQIVDY
ncbi:MAG: carbonic anhydrase [Planctomycetota bacterium]|nr:MAG: carbonic anhydrase [Planctomycetota bacterium]